MTYLPYMYKAIVPSIIGLVLSLLAMVGIGPEMTIEQVLTLLFTSLAVYLVPNKKAGE